MPDHYNLYLDESTSEPMFCVAGIIINKNQINQVLTEVNRIKQIIWSDLPHPERIILHEKDIKEVRRNGFANTTVISEYARFDHLPIARSLYIEVERAIKRLNVKIIGACVNKEELKNYYSTRNMTNKYLTAMQSIIENFAQFLIKHNATGTIILESRDTVGDKSIKSADRQVRTHFMNIMSIGSMFLSSQALQDVILGIEFIPKTANNPAIQLADFIPNQLARKETHRRTDIYAMYPELKKRFYNGTLGQPERFGVKIIPCVIPAPTPSSRTSARRSGRNRRRRGSRGRGTQSGGTST